MKLTVGASGGGRTGGTDTPPPLAEFPTERTDAMHPVSNIVTGRVRLLIRTRSLIAASLLAVVSCAGVNGQSHDTGEVYQSRTRTRDGILHRFWRSAGARPERPSPPTPSGHGPLSQASTLCEHGSEKNVKGS